MIVLLSGLATILSPPAATAKPLQEPAEQQLQSPGPDLAAAVAQKEQESSRLERSRQSEDHFLELSRRVRESGALPVIVRLRTAFRPESELNGPVEVRAQRTVIGRARQRLFDEMVGYDPGSIKDFDYLPYAAMLVNTTGIESLRASPDVLDVEEDALHRVSLSQSVAMIGADKAWSSGYTGAGQAVAIIDTGVDKSHPFLAGKVVAEACYSTNGSGSTSFCPGGVASSTATDSGVPCSVSGDCSHGTHVAGIAAGKGANFSGVARDASIIAIQAFSRFDNITTCGVSAPCALAYSSDIIRGLQRVYELRTTYSIAAVNLSLGGGRYTSECDASSGATKAAIDLLRSAGIATVVASGNESFTNALGSPACISTAVSVGSVSDSTGTVSSFSNSASFLSLLAPGASITSSTPGSSFDTWSGTSMASPHVAGAWAILKQKNPAASVSQVLKSLTSTGRSVTDTRNNISTPLIRVDEALKAPDTPDPVPALPKAPTALTATAISANQINLSWTDNSSNETGFRIYRKTEGASAWTLVTTVAAETATYQNTGLAGGTAYRFYVTSANTEGESSPSNEVIATTLNPPTTPASLTARTSSTTQIDLSWNDLSTNETGFRVRRRTSPTGIWTVIGTVGQNVTSFQSTGLTPGQIYYFVVTAYNPTGESGFSNQANATTTAVNRPDPPLNLTATATSSTEVSLSWQDNSNNETGFRVSRKTGATGTWIVIGTVGTGGTGARNTGLTAGATYVYRVVSFNTAGESAASNEVTVTMPDTRPSAPSSLVAAGVSTTEVALTWTDTSGIESGFRISRKTGTNGLWTNIGAVGPNVTALRDAALNAGTTYVYRVTAWNNSGESAASNEASATTQSVVSSPPPAAPRSLQATATSKTGVSLAWIDSSANETGFLVQRRTGSTGSWENLATTPAGATAYGDTGLTSGSTYFYRVRALVGTTESSASNEVGLILPLNSFTNLVSVQSVSGSLVRGESAYYKLFVPSGVTQLSFETTGSGDVDLYVRSDSQPTRSIYNCRSISANSTERCVITNPRSGDWYVLV
ncbi:MAG: hypothetical protein EBZ36_08855, partial [Acidobacteria bacterium]|nr:hypothetical protein [Acidobacteriota bacterium]